MNISIRTDYYTVQHTAVFNIKNTTQSVHTHIAILYCATLSEQCNTEQQLVTLLT